MKIVTNSLLWLTMTIRRKPLFVLGALVAVFLAPRFEIIFHKLASPVLDPLLMKLPSNDARDCALVQWSWCIGLGLLFLPWRFAKPLGWSLIGWKIVDTFKK